MTQLKLWRSYFRLLSDYFRSPTFLPAQSRRRKPPASRCRPLLEELEDRTLLQANAVWDFLGPQPLSESPLGSGIGTFFGAAGANVSGRINAIAIGTSTEGGPDMLVGTASGGIWMTTSLDGNQFANSPVWTQVSDNVDYNSAQPILPDEAPPGINSISTLAFDPRPNYNSIVYAGTGDANYNPSNAPGCGILKSYDGGELWYWVSPGPADAFIGQSISKIIVTPDGTVFAAVVPGAAPAPTAVDGVYKSSDGGDTWTKLNVGSGIIVPTDLEYTNVAGTITLYAGLGNVHAYDAVNSNANGIYTSSDMGATWQPATGAGAPLGAAIGRISLAANKAQQPAGTNPIVYAAVASASPTGSTLTAVLSTNNGGATWTTRVNAATVVMSPTGLALGSLADPGINPNNVGFAFGHQASYDLSIAEDPTDPNIVYLGGVHTYQSKDDGATWTQIDVAAPGGLTPSAYTPHVDHHAWAFYGNAVFDGDDGGIFEYAPTLADPAVMSWLDMNSTQDGLGTLQVNSVATAINAAGAEIYVAGSQDNGLAYYNPVNPVPPAAAVPVGWTTSWGGDGGEVQFSPSNPNIVYAVINGSSDPFVVSITGGQTPNGWGHINAGIDTTGLQFAPVFAVSPAGTLSNGARIVFGANTGIFLLNINTANFGNVGAANVNSWSNKTGDLGGAGLAVRAITFALGSDSIVYVGFSNGAVYMTDDINANQPAWTLVSPSTATKYPVTSIVMSDEARAGLFHVGRPHADGFRINFRPK